jgi:hypothetical protein
MYHLNQPLCCDRRVGTFITSGLLIAFLGILVKPVNAQSPIQLTIAQTPDTAKTNAIEQQLSGTWQTQDPQTGQVITFIFASDGNLFTIVPASDGSSVAVKFGYKINPTTQPMQLDMIVNPEQTMLTIFELTPQGKLHLELAGLEPGNPRPNAFTSTSTFFTKVSDVTTVPENLQVITLEPPKQSDRQRVVQQFLTILNKAQKDYYLKHNKFAASIDELGIITNLETEHYRYQIVPQKDNTQSVMMTATAKTEELPSYTSAVFVTQVDGKKATKSQICQTEKPSTSPPVMATSPQKEAGEVQCPVGSRSLQ